MKIKTFKTAYFNYQTLIAKIGNSKTGYEELQCIRIPKFTRTVSERSSEGNGWYGKKEKVTKVYDNIFVIIKDKKPYGVLWEPYHEKHNIKSAIFPIEYKFEFKEITEFINSINI